MRYSLSTLHLELTPQDFELLEEKINRLGKILIKPNKIEILLRHDTHHKTGEVIKCLINIHQQGQIHHVERTGVSVQTTLDDSIEAIKSELIKKKQKRRSVSQRNNAKS